MRITPPIDKGRISTNPDGSLRITDQFDPPRHMGVDYSCVVGAPICAACDGVAYRGSQPSGFGLYVRLEAPGSMYVYTAHLNAWAVADGARVRAGDVIGYSGNTGNSSGPHLHFEVRVGSRDPSEAVDPEPMIEWPGMATDSMLTTLHVQRYAGWQNAFARDVGAQWIKVVNPPEGMPLFPDVPHVAVRIWTDPTDARYIAQGREGGKRFVRDMLPRWRRVQVRGPAYELWNEPECNSNVGLANLREATLGTIEEADAQGITLIILNLAEANPHDNDTHNEAVVAWKWNELAPAIKAAIRGGHYLGRHCYWRPGVEGPTGRWHALGRLKADLDMLRDLGVDVNRLKVLVTEWGIDGGIDSHTPEQGWQIVSDADTYRAQIVEGEAYARTELPQVEMMALFTSGYLGQWGSYDHDVTFCGSLIQPLRALGSVTQPEPAPGPYLPSTDPLTLASIASGDMAQIWPKRRWWNEDATRKLQYGDAAGALAILEDMATPVTGLDYVIERLLT